MESLVSALRRKPSAFSPRVEGVVNEVEGSVVDGQRVLMAFRKSLHEVDLALVLSGPRAFPGPPSASERHVPALIACIPQRCVVVLQNNLCEDAVTTLAIFLQEKS